MLENLIPSMDFIVGGIVVGLSVAGIRAYFNKRRLYLIVPKMFSYSELSSNGQVIELTIINKGKRSEEDVQVKLSPSFKYDVIASTLPGLKIDSNSLIKIDRLSQSEEVSVVVNVDNGEFNNDNILSISSKETKGEIKKKIEESESQSAGELIAVVFFIFILMPLIGYLFGNIFVDEIWPSISPETKQERIDADKLKLGGWENIENFVGTEHYYSYNGKWPIEVEFPKREGGLLSFKINFSNMLDERIEFTASASTPYNSLESKIRSEWTPNNYESGILLLPGTKTSRTIEVYLPFNADPKLVVFEFHMEAQSKTYRFRYAWQYKK